MELGAALLAVGAGERAASFELFRETLDAEWIAQALEATGTATIRAVAAVAAVTPQAMGVESP